MPFCRFSSPSQGVCKLQRQTKHLGAWQVLDALGWKDNPLLLEVVAGSTTGLKEMAEKDRQEFQAEGP